MKKIIAGGFILLSGIILYLGMHISAAIFMPNINGWTTPPGRFGTALRESGGYSANIFAIILCIVGLFIILYECYLREMTSGYRKTLALRNMEYKKEFESDNN